MLNGVREGPDQAPLEREMRADTERVVETYGDDPHVRDRDLVVLDAVDQLGMGVDRTEPAAE